MKLVIGFLLVLLAGSGCATPPGHPFGIWQGGMRMPTNQACNMVVNGDDVVLEPCTGWLQP